MLSEQEREVTEEEIEAAALEIFMWDVSGHTHTDWQVTAEEVRHKYKFVAKAALDAASAAALHSAQVPAMPVEIEECLKNAGLTSRDGTFVSAPTREIVAVLLSFQTPAKTSAWNCATCHDDPHECAKIPMRHCEKLQRDTASAPRTYADGIEDAAMIVETCGEPIRERLAGRIRAIATKPEP